MTDAGDGAARDLTLLREGAQMLGFRLDERQMEQFALYRDTLLDWNRRINLTSITDSTGVQVRHFLDSLAVGAALRDELGGQPPPPGFGVLDVGAGAGFPGLPLRIAWPQIRLTLADSVAKKTTFLREISTLLGFEEVRMVTSRAEEMGLNREHREQYDCVTARALAPLPALAEYCLPLAKVGGLLLAPKKGDISLELAESERAVQVLGGGKARLWECLLPTEETPRYVVVVRKERATPPGYPRRVGLAKTRPIK